MDVLINVRITRDRTSAAAEMGTNSLRKGRLVSVRVNVGLFSRVQAQSILV